MELMVLVNLDKVAVEVVVTTVVVVDDFKLAEVAVEEEEAHPLFSLVLLVLPIHKGVELLITHTVHFQLHTQHHLPSMEIL